MAPALILTDEFAKILFLKSILDTAEPKSTAIQRVAVALSLFPEILTLLKYKFTPPVTVVIVLLVPIAPITMPA